MMITQEEYCLIVDKLENEIKKLNLERSIEREEHVQSMAHLNGRLIATTVALQSAEQRAEAAEEKVRRLTHIIQQARGNFAQIENFCESIHMRAIDSMDNLPTEALADRGEIKC